MPFSCSLVVVCFVFACDGVLDLHFDAFAFLARHRIHDDDAFDEGAQDFCVQMIELGVPSDMLHECFEVNRLLLILGEEFVEFCNSRCELSLRL